MKNKGGRPRKLTYEIKDAIVEGVEKGMTLKAACKYAGISYAALANWKKLAKIEAEESALYKDLILSIDAASRLAWCQYRQQALSSIKKEDLKFKQPQKKIYLTKKEIEEKNIAYLMEGIIMLEKRMLKS